MSLTRRSIVAGIALPAVLPVASAAAISDRVPRSEAALIALGRELEEAQRLREAAYGRLADAEERAVYPPESDALIATNWDMGNALPMPAARHSVRGRTWTAGQIERIRLAAPRREDTISARRRAEILMAYDAHAAAVRAEDEALGLPGLQAAYDAASERRDAIAARIIDMPAVSVAGLVVKARALVMLYGELPEVEAGVPSSDNGFRSIVADLLAIEGTA